MLLAYKIEFPRYCDWLCGQWERIFETGVDLQDSGHIEALPLGTFSFQSGIQGRNHLP